MKNANLNEKMYAFLKKIIKIKLNLGKSNIVKKEFNSETAHNKK